MCSFCGQALQPGRPGFNETCGSCGKDLHSCHNCRFYKPGARWDCAETIVDKIIDKQRRNLCECFEIDPRLFSEGPGRSSDREAANKARGDLDKLFGG